MNEYINLDENNIKDGYVFKKLNANAFEKLVK